MPIIHSVDRKVIPVIFVLDAVAFSDREKWAQVKYSIKQSIKCLSNSKCEPCVYILEYSSVPVWTIEELRYVNDVGLVWNHSRYDGKSNLGFAFDALNQRMQKEQMFSDSVIYEKPLVVVLTGGKSDDDWKSSYNALAKNPWFQSSEVVGAYLFPSDEKIIETISSESPIPVNHLESFISNEAIFCRNFHETENPYWEISLLGGAFSPLNRARFIMNHELEMGTFDEKPKVAFKVQFDNESVLVAHKSDEHLCVQRCIRRGENGACFSDPHCASSVWICGSNGKAKVKFVASDRVFVENIGENDLKIRARVSETIITLNDGDCIIGENGEALLAVKRICGVESTSELLIVRNAEQ